MMQQVFIMFLYLTSYLIDRRQLGSRRHMSGTMATGQTRSFPLHKYKSSGEAIGNGAFGRVFAFKHESFRQQWQLFW